MSKNSNQVEITPVMKLLTCTGTESQSRPMVAFHVVVFHVSLAGSSPIITQALWTLIPVTTAGSGDAGPKQCVDFLQLTALEHPALSLISIIVDLFQRHTYSPDLAIQS